MAYWDYENGKIVYWGSKKSKDWPGWLEIDCGCCCGIEWGGEYPVECRKCGGKGFIFLHIESNARAMYPGGPFC